jgi:hypothetical protein
VAQRGISALTRAPAGETPEPGLPAISDGLAYLAFSAEYIANILETRARSLPEPGPLQLIRRHDLLDIDIPSPDLNVYDGGTRDPE